MIEIDAMKRVMCMGVGDASEMLRLVDADEPVPGPRDAVVEIAARPINPADLLLIHGRHFAKPTFPAPIGIEGSGVVVALGAEADGPPVGTKVAVPYGGTWSERVAIPAADLIALPPDADLRQASMLSVNPVTAASMLEGLSAGDWVLQNAAASAVGRLVVRIAARRGLRTVNIVRREEQVAELKALGADVVLVGDHALPARVGDAGVKITRALDAVAGEASGRMFDAVADGGELWVYGLLSDDRVILQAARVVFRSVIVRGYSRLRVLRSMPKDRARALFDDLAALARDGALDSEVEAVYPLAEVAAAVAHHERPSRRGKILLAG
jgi:mitochondrial enoyl-[acyl-carrier protein] reductase / trans-2-enoyl-CoA reductase